MSRRKWRSPVRPFGELLSAEMEKPCPPTRSSCCPLTLGPQLAMPEDHEVLRTKGLSAMRQQRLAGLARQGAGPRRTVERRRPRLSDVFVDGHGETGSRRMPGCGDRRAHPWPDPRHGSGGQPQGPDRVALSVGSAVHRDRAAHAALRVGYQALPGGLPPIAALYARARPFPRSVPPPVARHR